MKKAFVKFGNGQIMIAVETIGNEISVEAFDEQESQSKQIILPSRFLPDLDFLKDHNKERFKQ